MIPCIKTTFKAKCKNVPIQHIVVHKKSINQKIRKMAESAIFMFL